MVYVFACPVCTAADGNLAALSVPLEIFEALVVSVVALVASPLTSLAAGCACDGTPLVEILVRNWWLTDAMLSTPPNAVADGFGNLPAPSVPLLMLLAFVVSIVAEAASPDTSEAAGCA